MQITKEFTIDLAHRLTNHPSKCINVHWHTYRIQVSVRGDIKENWMVMDFGEFKKIKSRCDENWDHSYLYKVGDEVWEFLKEKWYRVFSFGVEPTAENMAIFLKQIVAIEFDLLEEDVTIRMYETPTSYAQA